MRKSSLSLAFLFIFTFAFSAFAHFCFKCVSQASAASVTCQHAQKMACQRKKKTDDDEKNQNSLQHARQACAAQAQQKCHCVHAPVKAESPEKFIATAPVLDASPVIWVNVAQIDVLLPPPSVHLNASPPVVLAKRSQTLLEFKQSFLI